MEVASKLATLAKRTLPVSGVFDEVGCRPDAAASSRRRSLCPGCLPAIREMREMLPASPAASHCSRQDATRGARPAPPSGAAALPAWATFTSPGAYSCLNTSSTTHSLQSTPCGHAHVEIYVGEGHAGAPSPLAPQLIRAIGESKSKSEEDAIVAKLVELSKAKIREGRREARSQKELLVYLIYIEMLGHDTGWAQAAAIQLCSDKNLAVKKVGNCELRAPAENGRKGLVQPAAHAGMTPVPWQATCAPELAGIWRLHAPAPCPAAPRAAVGLPGCVAAAGAFERAGNHGGGHYTGRPAQRQLPHRWVGWAGPCACWSGRAGEHAAMRAGKQAAGRVSNWVWSCDHTPAWAALCSHAAVATGRYDDASLGRHILGCADPCCCLLLLQCAPRCLRSAILSVPSWSACSCRRQGRGRTGGCQHACLSLSSAAAEVLSSACPYAAIICGLTPSCRPAILGGAARGPPHTAEDLDSLKRMCVLASPVPAGHRPAAPRPGSGEEKGPAGAAPLHPGELC